MPSLGVIGECMLEFRHSNSGDYRLGYGGDAFNTAVYAARLGLDVGFISCVGDDHYSQWLLEQWQAEGVDCRHVRQLAACSPALYIIRNDAQGERYFHYWREASPFRQLLEGLQSSHFSPLLENYDAVYFTGIGLALLTSEDRQVLLQSLSEYRASGGRVMFDPNYRPILWASKDEAALWTDAAYAVSNTILPSLDDELSLRDPVDQSVALQRLQMIGVDEVVIKDGPAGCSVIYGSTTTHYPIQAPMQPVDTTAAGDSFNAAYLHARMANEPIATAVATAQALAAVVVMHSGAILPKEQMQ